MKKHMKANRFVSVPLALLLLIASLLTLVACHGSKGLDPFTVPDTLDTEKQIELTFWAKNDTNKTQTRIYEKAIEDFHTLYPNITVNMRLYTDYSRIYNDIITNISTMTTPNICITYPDHIATYLTGTNIVAPLDELMENEKYGLGGSELRFTGVTRDEILPAFLSEGVIEGTQYAVPFMRSTEACYINRDLVEKLGYTIPDVLTWDFIWEVCETSLAQNEDGTYKINGQKVLIPFIYKSTDNMMIQYTKQAGSGYSTEDGEILLFNDTTRDFLYTIAEHTATGAFSTFKISSYPGNFLNAGQCLFAIDSTAGATWMGTDAPLSDISEDKLVRFTTVVRPVPQLNPGNPIMISQGPSLCIFNKKDSGEVLASWLFVQYLLSDEVQIAYAETEGYVPVTRSARSSPAYLDYLARAGEDNNVHYDVKIQATKLLLTYSDTGHTFTTPVFNGSASLRDAAGQLIENVTRSVKRHETVDEAYMEHLYSETVSLYRLDQIGMGHTSVGKADLGALPTASVALLATLGGIWILIAAYQITDICRKKRKKQKNPNNH